MEVLTNIPVNLELEVILQRMRIRNRHDVLVNQVEDFLEIIRPIVNPKAVYDVAYVDNKSEDSVEIGGVRFSSRVLKINLDKVERVFPYIVTCGTELDAEDVFISDYFKGYCLDTIKLATVTLARKYLEDFLKKRYATGQLSRMGPGSGSAKDWPINQQEELFSLFGGKSRVEELIGVKLTDRFIMIPIKSVSGIFFPTEVKFESCQLCPREKCRGRRAPYDQELVKEYHHNE